MIMEVLPGDIHNPLRGLGVESPPAFLLYAIDNPFPVSYLDILFCFLSNCMTNPIQTALL